MNDLISNVAGDGLIERDRTVAGLSRSEAGLGRWCEAAQTAVFRLFVCGLAWVPFWFGSNTSTAWGVNAVIFPGLLAVYEATLLVGGMRHPVALRAIALPAGGFAVVVAFIVLQNATWTPGVLHHPIWSMAADTLAPAPEGSISVNRDLTAQALLRLVTAASVFWLALQFGRDARRAYRLLAAIAVIVTLYAAYGSIARAVAPGQILWFKDPAVGAFVSSTFYNPDHFACYAAIGLIVAFGLLLRVYREAPRGAASLRVRAADFLDTTGKSGAACLSGVVVIAAALMLTGSRGGIVTGLIGCAVYAFLAFGRRGRSRGEQVAVVGLFGLLVAAVFIVFGDAFFGKIRLLGFGDVARLSIYALTAGSIASAPWLGHGYGTFADVFPMFRDRSIDIGGQWTAAHDTYLEIFQGLGLVFGALLIAVVAALVLRCLTGALMRRADAAVPAIAFSVSCLVALDALVDFALQIQAVTLTFMAILGAGVAQSASSRVVLQD